MAARPGHILPILRAMFDPNISVAAHLIGAASSPLSEIEEKAIARAIPARQAEFRAGRHVAKAALAEIGAPYLSIPMGNDRAPIWPTGFTGTISHCEGLAIAAASRLNGTKSLGLDMEKACSLEPDLWASILTPDERTWLEKIPVIDQGLYAKVLFSIKECLYKAQYGITRSMLEFDAFTAKFDLVTGNFEAAFQHKVEPFHRGQVIRGKVALTKDIILTSTTL